MLALDQLRVDHVGSLLRPSELREAWLQHADGALTDDQLQRVQDVAVRRLVAQEEAHNLPLVTDGEYRRAMFMESATRSFSGLAGWRRGLKEQAQPGQAPRRGEDASVKNQQAVTEPVRLVRNLPLEEYQSTARLTDRPIKVTYLSVDRIRQHADFQPAYESAELFVADLVAAQRAMLAGLVAAGCPYVQTDAPSYTAYVDAESIAALQARGEDPAVFMRQSIAADNAVIADFPDITFGVHLCRGNRQGLWHREGGYDAIAEELFSSLNHQRLLLEYDTPRAGSFEPLRFVPQGKTAVLGLISTKTPELESVDALRRRLDEAATYLPLERLALSPQCGFSSSLGGNALTEEDQWRKLDLMLETARLVWG